MSFIINAIKCLFNFGSEKKVNINEALTIDPLRAIFNEAIKGAFLPLYVLQKLELVCKNWNNIINTNHDFVLHKFQELNSKIKYYNNLKTNINYVFSSSDRERLNHYESRKLELENRCKKG